MLTSFLTLTKHRLVLAFISIYLLTAMGSDYTGDGGTRPPIIWVGYGNANVPPRFIVVLSCYCVLFPFDCSLFFVAVCTDALLIDLTVAGI